MLGFSQKHTRPDGAPLVAHLFKTLSSTGNSRDHHIRALSSLRYMFSLRSYTGKFLFLFSLFFLILFQHELRVLIRGAHRSKFRRTLSRSARGICHVYISLYRLFSLSLPLSFTDRNLDQSQKLIDGGKKIQ